MRKRFNIPRVFYYFHWHFWVALLYVICTLWIVAFLTSCASLSLTPPTTQFIIQDITQTTGYLIGKNNPELAREFIKHTDPERTDLVTHWAFWKNYLAYKLTDDDGFQRMKVQKWLSLVDIRLELRTDEEKVEIIRELFGEFIAGLQEGINANR